MRILGIESSCDECAAAVVEDGRTILSDVVATQIPFHEKYQGVVPEIASRKHSEWISGVVGRALAEAGLAPAGLDGIAVTSRPGLTGSLLVGLSFAKGLAWATGKRFVGVNHMLAHLYASRLAPPGEEPSSFDYPFLGLLVSGGHSIICRVEDFDRIEVLGTTIDDAVGEAFDKVAKHYGFGYPGGAAIDRLAEAGDESAFAFPRPSLHKGEHRYDLSYSGLKTAAIYQLEQYRKPGAESSPENIAASFRKAAVDLLLSRLFRAAEDTGLRRVVAGGGVAANSYLRRSLAARSDLEARFPPLRLCGDNGAMVAGIGCRYLERGESSGFDLNASARVPLYRKL
ncbi:MAG TPA: tRNA (adenosine(37)-N6)-threonylcarbamoyltransferase complex transferase subunit TsaD [Spirochaetales bacterium]|nr:tRNA (adenosine(37)-N6)-threonylcarbamoyltransferase complex transferase subunit TsaD [Spirochaetales bacterium]HRY54220.1 tRNA (adenosine(37)-N6)-threonylcarbamoyltransferase complex transferase subunit TsaD [Spirochaetia bacterium]HRZ66015.1 tRNA (adenosine(37)-N6)-threonylcarbamoyltransferase complex transferase subunit TsaD [Spirochaetia bacterium]